MSDYEANQTDYFDNLTLSLSLDLGQKIVKWPSGVRWLLRICINAG
jgi:hypothetical protein